MSCSRLLLPAVLGLALAACETPPVFGTSDPRQNQQASRIEGNVVVQSRTRGNAVVFLFDAARPPPPQGTGRPLSFTVIPSAQLFGNALGDLTQGGPFTAPFAFSLVAPGNYLLRGFIDRDECVVSVAGCITPDFIPWYGVTGEPNRGDVGGAAVDAVTRQPRIVSIGGGTERLLPATDVSVTFTDLAAVPADRPVFAITSGDSLFSPGTAMKVLELTPTPINEGLVHQRQPVFFAKYVDDNLDGVPDDADGDGLGDFWPKVVVRKLKDTPPFLTDENDEDRNGIIDPTGTDYAPAAGNRDGKPDLVVLAAGLDPSLILPALTDSGGKPKLEPVPVPKLRLVLRMLALDVSSGVPVPLASVPTGRYAIILQQFTGQTWRVPNELQPGVAAATGLPTVDTQGFAIEVR